MSARIDTQTFLLRGRLLHVPRDPFVEENCLETWSDGAVAIAGGRIRDLGEYSEMRGRYPEAECEDLRPAVILPGFVDAHVHYPQLPVIGAMGLSLIEWLHTYCLPEEVRLRNEEHARALAQKFVKSLVRNGTTTALVFGSHFPLAQEALFQEALKYGLDLCSGLVISDRDLLPELLLSPGEAYEASASLAARWHGKGRIRYAVTPRFALSATEEMLRIASALLDACPGALLTTHANENRDEVSAVLSLFPWAAGYLDVYDRFGLLRREAVLAHNVHVTDGELGLLATSGAAVAHCPSSNAFLGSGVFSLGRHVEMGIPVCLGSDVGAGTGFGILKEALAAYQLQRVTPDGFPLTPSHLLYMMTLGGARALGRGDEVGDLRPGKRADLVVVSPERNTTLAEMWDDCASDEHLLGALFCLGTEQQVERVYIAGKPVWIRGSRDGRRCAQEA